MFKKIAKKIGYKLGYTWTKGASKTRIVETTVENDTGCNNSEKPNPDLSLYFVVGCARSGTTSLAKILDDFTNGVCLMEPEPNLGYESRKMLDGAYTTPFKLVAETIINRAASVLDSGFIYGEKNVTLGPFIPYIDKLANAKFVYVKRDGRDVVRSLINWHNQMFGNIYRECSEPGDLSDRARKVIKNLPIEDDMSDYARPRPGPDNMWYEKWPTFTRLEMCAWYWSYINELLIEELEKLDQDKWKIINYTHPQASDIMSIAEFLELEGLDSLTIQELLDRKINSVEDRIGKSSDFPKWDDWTPTEKAQFECIAFNSMKRMGFYEKDRLRYKPGNYGDWWKQHEGGTKWYEWMYNSRLSAHEDLKNFIITRNENVEGVASVLDVGCGRAIGYKNFLKDYRFVGYDLSQKEIQWCRDNNDNPNHEYLCGDFITDLPNEKFDIVFSQGTIDNSYDINAYLKSMVLASKGWVYITAYRGWFPILKEHRYSWDNSTTCFYNDISPNECKLVLEELGCTNISITKLKMENAAVEYETRIIAKAPLNS